MKERYEWKQKTEKESESESGRVRGGKRVGEWKKVSGKEKKEMENGGKVEKEGKKKE